MLKKFAKFLKKPKAFIEHLKDKVQLLLIKKLIKGSGTHGFHPIINDIFFEEQQGIDFQYNLASYLINATNYAYNQFIHASEGYPKNIKNPTQLHWHNGFSDPHETLCGFIGIITDDAVKNSILITIRGTVEPTEWFTDTNFEQVNYSLKNGAIQGKIHDGFHHIYTKPSLKNSKSLQTQIQEALNTTYLSKTKKNRVYLTGHSLGAALTTLIAADLGVTYPDLEIVCYNFGSPRVGNIGFATSFSKFFNKRPTKFVFIRVFNIADLVTIIPFPVFPGKKIDYNHTETFISYSQPKNKVSQVLGFPINVHHNNIAANHNLMAYYCGIWNGEKPCLIKPTIVNKSHKKENKSHKDHQ